MKNTALKINNDLTPLSADEFESRLRDIGKERYHDNCKFHHLLHSGKLNKGQVQAWALNRYYYQINISIKDSALMSKLKIRAKKGLDKRMIMMAEKTMKVALKDGTSLQMV